MTSIDILGVTAFILIILFLLSTAVRQPEKKLYLATPLLIFKCVPSDDPEITCIFCGRPVVDLEYTYQTTDRLLTSGVHYDCLDNPRHRAVSPEELCGIVKIV